MSPTKLVLTVLIIQTLLTSCSRGTENLQKTEEVYPTIQPVPPADTFSFESVGISDDSLAALFTSEDGSESVVVDKFAGTLVNANGECQRAMFVLVKVTLNDIEEISLYNLNYNVVNGEHTIALSVEETFPVGFQTSKIMSISVDSTLHDRCNVLVVTDFTNFGEADGSSTMKTLYSLNESGVLQQILYYSEESYSAPDEYDTISEGARYTLKMILPSVTGIDGFKDLQVSATTTQNYDTVSTEKSLLRYSTSDGRYVKL